MQRSDNVFRFIIVAFFAWSSSAADLVATSAEAQAEARAWVQQHRHAQPDELAELKGANPEAYALVKALLTKNSLGLLKRRGPPPAQVDAAAGGAPDAAEPQEQQVSTPVASSSPAAVSEIRMDAPKDAASMRGPATEPAPEKEVAPPP